MGGKATNGKRVSRADGIMVGLEVMGECPIDWFFAGSIRREQPDVGDVDLVVLKHEWVITRLTKLFGSKENGSVQTRGLVAGIQVDVYMATREDVGAQLFTWTGSPSFNIRMRGRAKSQNMLLNQYGLFQLKDRRKMASRTEEDLFDALGIEYVPPSKRA